MSRRGTAVDALARALLRLYPADFRLSHGAELLADLERIGDPRGRGRSGDRLSALRALIDVALRLPQQWIEHWNDQRTGRAGMGGWEMWIDRTLQDVRFALRGLARQPAFTVAAVGTIALGIGANAAIFSAVHGVVLRPLPYPDSDELATVWRTERGEGRDAMSQPDLRDLQSEASSLAGLVGYSTTGRTFTGFGPPERINGVRVTDGILGVFGLQPALGRDVRSDENIPDGPRVMVISHAFWQDRFAGSPDVLGKTLQMNGEPWEIVGVAPEGFDFPGDARYWVPWRMDTEGCGRGCHIMLVVARLADGATVEAAGVELSSIAARLEREYPDSNFETDFQIVGLQDAVVGDVRRALWMMMGAVGMVLLVACANVANLLLVRATSRGSEVAVRTALGAPRRRILRQLMTESLTLAALGGVLGLALARGGVALLRSMAPADLPRVDEIGLDATVLVFAAALVGLVALVFGLVPALRSSRAGHGGLSGSRGAGARRRRSPLFDASLLTGEVALSLMLLTGAVLLARSFGRLTGVDLGYQTSGVTSFSISLPAAEYEPDERVVFFEALEQRLAALPGVEAAGAIFGLPLGANEISASAKLLDRPPVPEGQDPTPLQRVVTPGYFDAMGIRLVSGRGIERDDRLGSQPVVVVNEALARAYYGDQDPLGKTMELGFSWGYPEEEPRTVVGVVRDHRSQALTMEARPELFIPQAQFAPSYLSFVIRASGDAEAVLAGARTEVGALDSNLPLVSPRTMDDVVDEVLATPRFFATLLGLFSALSVALAAVGLYGVVAYAVSRRTREIGIRTALGADSGRVVRMMLGQGLRPAALGLALGLLLTRVGTRALDSLLYDVERLDPASLAMAAAGLALVVCVSSVIPARRAARVAPSTALRE